MKPADFEQLFADHAPALLSFLAYRVGDRALAEDLLADTFERALRSRKRYDPAKAKAKTWLYAIALNLVRDAVRRSAVEDRALGVVAEDAATARGPEIAVVVEARVTVAEALEVLAPEEREAIALRYGAELTVPEIATTLGLPLTTVEGRVYRALRKLKAALD